MKKQDWFQSFFILTDFYYNWLELQGAIMTKQCLTKQELMERLGEFSPAEKKEIREYLQRKNPLLFRKFERMKHELFRLESRRIQCEIEKNEKELNQLDHKILMKKEHFLELLIAIRKKRG